ncbi:MAG: hypothetical protein QM679_07810 [Patulibacter sp.]
MTTALAISRGTNLNDELASTGLAGLFAGMVVLLALRDKPAPQNRDV